MIRIAISAAAFDAIAATLPLGTVAYEHERTASSGYLIWLDHDKLFAERRLWRGHQQRDLAAVRLSLIEGALSVESPPPHCGWSRSSRQRVGDSRRRAIEPVFAGASGRRWVGAAGGLFALGPTVARTVRRASQAASTPYRVRTHP